MPYPPITALPAVPSRNAPATFSALMDAFLAAFPQFRTEVNALAAYLDILAVATGPGLFLNGSAAAPGISFASDPGSGFYRAGANDIRLALGGADAGLFRRGNILGTVSQASGVPTGTIIERGSNANGAYTRWADGTQICVMPAIINSSVAADTGIEATWTLPAAFATGATPSVSPNVRSLNDSMNRAAAAKHFGATLTQNSNTSVVVTAHNRDTSARQVRVDVTAIGPWF